MYYLPKRPSDHKDILNDHSLDLTTHECRRPQVVKYCTNIIRTITCHEQGISLLQTTVVVRVLMEYRNRYRVIPMSLPYHGHTCHRLWFPLNYRTPHRTLEERSSVASKLLVKQPYVTYYYRALVVSEMTRHLNPSWFIRRFGIPRFSRNSQST